MLNHNHLRLNPLTNAVLREIQRFQTSLNAAIYHSKPSGNRHQQLSFHLHFKRALYPNYLLQIISGNYLSQTITIQPKPSTPSYTMYHIQQSSSTHLGVSNNNLFLSAWNNYYMQNIYYRLFKTIISSKPRTSNQNHSFLYAYHASYQNHSLLHIRYITLSNQVVHSSMSPTIISSSLFETIITSKIFVTNF